MSDDPKLDDDPVPEELPKSKWWPITMSQLRERLREKEKKKPEDKGEQ